MTFITFDYFVNYREITVCDRVKEGGDGVGLSLCTCDSGACFLCVPNSPILSLLYINQSPLKGKAVLKTLFLCSAFFSLKK